MLVKYISNTRESKIRKKRVLLSMEERDVYVLMTLTPLSFSYRWNNTFFVICTILVSRHIVSIFL